jgi:hypothetical protein
MLTIESDGVERSHRMAEQLIALNDTLGVTRHIHIDEARNNLQAMIQVSQELAGQTQTIAESVENLELLADFQTVLNEQLGQIEGVRRQLTELVLMESMMARAARALAPLAELGNMRGLDEQEMRDAARVILDRRTSRTPTSTRMAEKESEVISVSSPDDVFDAASRPVPIPPAE